MRLSCKLILTTFLISFIAFSIQQLYPPTRPIDLWNPFGTTTTRHPGQKAGENEIIVRLSVGDIVGKKILLHNLPWTANQDPSDQIPAYRINPEPNPLPPLNNVTVYAFLGIPYAEMPTAQRRFKPPQRITQLPGESPYVAFDYQAACAQDIEMRSSLFVHYPYPYRVNEDCLYLNIFTPQASNTPGQQYPVVVFIHGGNFQTGSANEWPGHVLASRGIVVVTINYRLGPFGFMSLGDPETSNRGIQDQREALTFVQQYISAFGGDPRAVTIIGHDAGAVSAGVHMLSPYSKGMFRNVVAMSGADVSYHSIIGKPALAFNNTMKLGRYLGCVQQVAQNVWDCILTRSMQDIVLAASPVTVPHIQVEYNRYLFMPSVDGYELKAHPLVILNNAPSGLFNVPSAVPYLTGVNKEDGVEVILEDRNLGEFTNFLEVDHEYQKQFLIEYVFRHNYTMNKEAIVEAIDSYYTYWPDPADVWKIREKFIDLTTDTYYAAPVSQSANLHSMTGSRTFMYVNNYNFSKTRENRPIDTTSPFPSWAGSCHDCDLYLLFGFPFMPKELLPQHFKDVEWYETDRNASQLFGAFIRRFVQTSDPNLPFGGSWAAHQPREHWYMDFNYTAWDALTEVGILKRDYRYEAVAFWNNYIPMLVNYMTTTFAPEEVRVRRELMAFQVTTGVIAFVLMLVLVIALSLAYHICTRQDRQRQTVDHMRLVNQSENYRSTSRMEMQKMSSL